MTHPGRTSTRRAPWQAGSSVKALGLGAAATGQRIQAIVGRLRSVLEEPAVSSAREVTQLCPATRTPHQRRDRPLLRVMAGRTDSGRAELTLTLRAEDAHHRRPGQ